VLQIRIYLGRVALIARSGRSAFRYKGSLTNDSNIEPIPALNRTDADLFLIFLSANDILYPKEVNDPW
jgi:hypothetical protein